MNFSHNHHSVALIKDKYIMTKIIQWIILTAVLCSVGILHAEKSLPSSDQICLATVMYHEAGNQPVIGQEAVAEVIMNRVRHGFAKDACSVVRQHVGEHWQFGSYVLNKNVIPSHRRNYFYMVAQKVLNGETNLNFPENVLYFNNTLFDRTRYIVYQKIGSQYFFIRRKGK
jgi:spore germination cell wall hydrolase CwlJ-like protein